MNRREVLLVLAAAGLAGAAWRYWPEDGVLNPCLDAPLPRELRDHPLVLSAWIWMSDHKGLAYPVLSCSHA